nr:DUF397 domain-containing protein [Kibdelosporangium sp. MJ126-NF4]CEL18802.1 hypothetical protein [Kibdelosporangium sp. MJ126-NF4]CTQ96345.1 hypothetical protein [Kibdelosporangium sp. MJ126-NF4]
MELTWRKSSYSTGDEDAECVEVAWHKSSYSTDHGECVEVASLPVLLSAVRDSKNPTATLTFPTAPWHAFLTNLAGQRG